MIKYTIISLFILAAIPFCFVYSQNDAGEVFNSLVKKYGSANVLQINFKYGERDGIGSLTAQRGGKYRLVLGQRVIVCDGETVWNYSNDNNTVVISQYEEFSASFSPEQVFFDLVAGFEPTRLTTVTVSGNKPGYALHLKPKPVYSDNTSTIDEIILSLEKSSVNVKIIEIRGDSGNEKFFVERININPKLQPGSFGFKIPDNAKIVDLR